MADKSMKIILGSQSKGRKKILEEMGYKFEVMSANIDEKIIRFDDPKKLTLALAQAKADALKSRIFEPALLITSDQVVIWNGKIREKPENEKEAKEFLQGYNISPAKTITAVVVTDISTGKRVEGIDIAKVYFYPFSEKDINEIIKEGEAFHMAGGFTVDGQIWTKHIKKIEGTRDSVIGLSKSLTEKLIRKVGK